MTSDSLELKNLGFEEDKRMSIVMASPSLVENVGENPGPKRSL
jgi:hypothetical protein